MDVIIVSQFLENQEKIRTTNVAKKIINSPMLKLKIFLRLINLNNIHKNERKNITMPVGLLKNIKPI